MRQQNGGAYCQFRFASSSSAHLIVGFNESLADFLVLVDAAADTCPPRFDRLTLLWSQINLHASVRRGITTMNHRAVVSQYHSQFHVVISFPALLETQQVQWGAR
jgi:hypothetical protein